MEYLGEPTEHAVSEFRIVMKSRSEFDNPIFLPQVLSMMCRRLLKVSKRSVAELAGRATLEHAICVHVIAMAAVMAGSGDVDTVKLIRYLR